jgi:hypothetical protein
MPYPSRTQSAPTRTQLALIKLLWICVRDASTHAQRRLCDASASTISDGVRLGQKRASFIQIHFPVRLPVPLAAMRSCTHEMRARYCRTPLFTAAFLPGEGEGAACSYKTNAAQVLDAAESRARVASRKPAESVRKGRYPAVGYPAAATKIRPVFSSPLAQSRGVIRSNRSIRIDLTWPQSGQVAAAHSGSRRSPVELIHWINSTTTAPLWPDLAHSHSIVPGGLLVMS